ncbi:hypothetical protein NJC08_08230 [Pseudomonas fluorescens]|uniref:hypothetical protein n=1 Tax=Pseudomonas fluorescens TaxID=294 RepID=UPI00209B9AEB|nr:hypothetical protein [Pseudomonas fluorescens]MCO7626398.1 hypothetical protein [Pseudomonas fluorescens]
MLKATLAAASLFAFSLPAAFADIRQIDEAAIVKAIDAPVLKKVQEEDSPGCGTTRYTFGTDVFNMKLEFKCNRINVAWNFSQEPHNRPRSEQVIKLARRAVSILTQGNGVEVDRVLAGGKYKNRSFDNGLLVSGSCVTNQCLLTFK